MTVERGYDLVERMREHGAPDAEGWASAELSEGMAQEVRYLFLRNLWAEINGWNPETVLRVPAARRAIASGARAEDLVTAMRAAAYDTAFSLLHRIDHGCDEEAPEDSPGWVLKEARFRDDEPVLTGRDIIALHEDLLTLDPSGRDGADLWE